MTMVFILTLPWILIFRPYISITCIMFIIDLACQHTSKSLWFNINLDYNTWNKYIVIRYCYYKTNINVGGLNHHSFLFKPFFSESCNWDKKFVYVRFVTLVHILSTLLIMLILQRLKCQIFESSSIFCSDLFDCIGILNNHLMNVNVNVNVEI